MDNVPQLFDEWAASYARGEHPDPLLYIERAGVKADELCHLMDAFLRHAPRNEPSEQTVALMEAWVSGASPLAELRAIRGLRRDEVVDAVMRNFDFAPNARAKVKRYYHDLESGLLDPARLDNRLTDFLVRTLSASRDAILAWRPRPLEAQGAFLRASSALVTPDRERKTLEEPRDDIDDLFLSGS